MCFRSPALQHVSREHRQTGQGRQQARGGGGGAGDGHASRGGGGRAVGRVLGRVELGGDELDGVVGVVGEVGPVDAGVVAEVAVDVARVAVGLDLGCVGLAGRDVLAGEELWIGGHKTLESVTGFFTHVDALDQGGRPSHLMFVPRAELTPLRVLVPLFQGALALCVGSPKRMTAMTAGWMR